MFKQGCMTFDVLNAKISYPELAVNHDIEWRSLNSACHYETERHYLQGHSSLIPIYLYIQV